MHLTKSGKVVRRGKHLDLYLSWPVGGATVLYIHTRTFTSCIIASRASQGAKDRKEKEAVTTVVVQKPEKNYHKANIVRFYIHNLMILLMTWTKAIWLYFDS